MPGAGGSEQRRQLCRVVAAWCLSALGPGRWVLELMSCRPRPRHFPRTACAGAVCTPALWVQMAGGGGGAANGGMVTLGSWGPGSRSPECGNTSWPPAMGLIVLRTKEVDFRLTVTTGSCKFWAMVPQPEGSSQVNSFRERAWATISAPITPLSPH